MKHFIWADYAKAFAIFSVVLLHTHCIPELNVIINAYVIPLFIVVSGYLFSYKRNPDYKSFVRKRFRQIVIPYIWINVIAYTAWVFVLRHYGENSGDMLPIHLPLLAIVFGIPQWLVQDIPIWSLICFFVVELLFYPLGRRLACREDLVIIISFFVAAILYYCVPAQMARLIPMAFCPAVFGLSFYSLGYCMREYGKDKITSPRMVIFAVVFVIGMIVNGEADFYIFQFGCLPLYYITAVCGVLFIVGVCKWISKFGEPQIIRFISYGTLLICGFHLLLFAMLKGVALLGFGIRPYELTDGLGRGLLFSIVVFGLNLVIVYAVKRWARFLIDK